MTSISSGDGILAGTQVLSLIYLLYSYPDRLSCQQYIKLCCNFLSKIPQLVIFKDYLKPLTLLQEIVMHNLMQKSRVTEDGVNRVLTQ